MAKKSEPSFWRTVPGMLTAFAGAVTAIAGLVAVLSDAGILGPDERLAANPARAAAENSTALVDPVRPVEPPAEIAGVWRGAVTYPWGITVEETLDVRVIDERVIGTLSYLGVGRTIESPELAGNRISFTTRAEEILGDETRPYENRYDGLITPRGIEFILVDSRGTGPVEFTLRRE